MTILAIQLLLVGLCFTGPVFNTQVGMMFWLTTAMLYGAERTGAIEAWQAESEAWQAEADAQYAEDDGVDHWA